MNRITKPFPLAVVIALFLVAIPMADSLAAEYVVQPGVEPVQIVVPVIAHASIYGRVAGDAYFVAQTHQILQWLEKHNPAVFHFINALVDSIQPSPYHYAEACNLFYGTGTPSVRCT